MQAMILAVQVLWKPILSRTSWMKSHSSRSYALLMSVFTAIEHLFVAFECLRECLVCDEDVIGYSSARDKR